MARQIITFSFSQLQDYFQGAFPSPMVVDVRLKVIDVFGQESGWVTLECENSAPAAPTGLIATGYMLNIKLAWTQHPDSDLKHIAIYRNTTDDSGTATEIHRAGPKETTFADNSVLSGTSYYYWLKAVDCFDQVSAFSVGSGAEVALSVTDAELGDLMLIVPTDSDDNTRATLDGLWDADLDTVVVSYVSGDWVEYEYPTRQYLLGVRLSASADDINGYFAVADEEGNWTYCGGNSSTDHTVAGTTANELLRQYATVGEAQAAYVTLSGTLAGSHYTFFYVLGDSNATPANRLRLPQIVSKIRFYPLEAVSLTEYRPQNYYAAEMLMAGDIWCTRGIRLMNTAEGSGWILDKDGGTFLGTALTITGGLGTIHIADGAITAPKISVDNLQAISAIIGGWDIDADEIKKLSAGAGVTLNSAIPKIVLTDATYERVFIGKEGDDYYIKVRDAGGGVIFNSADAGTGPSLAGWNIDYEKISKANAVLHSDGYVSFGATPPTGYGDNIGAWLGYSTGAKLSLYSDANNYLKWDSSKLVWKGANTELDADGNLTASSATLSGTITAAAGSIGGWTILATELHNSEIWLDAAAKQIAIKSQAFGAAGLQAEFVAGTPSKARLYVGDGVDAFFQFDGVKLLAKAANFELDASGNIIASSATISGAITAVSGTLQTLAISGTLTIGAGGSLVAGTVTLSNTGFAATGDDVSIDLSTNGNHLWLSTTDPWLALGGATRATAPFRVTSAGALTATSGEIGGWAIGATTITSPNITLDDANDKITVGAGIALEGATQRIAVGTSNKIYIDGANERVETSNFASGVSGWRIGGTGDAEFNNVTVRGEFHCAVFVKDLLSAHAGTLLVSKSAGVLSNDMVVPASGTWDMYLNDPPGGGFLFDNADICEVRAEYSEGVGDTWFTVASQTDMEDGRQRYTCTYQSGTKGNGGDITYPAGVGVVDWGVSGGGVVRMTADLSNAPYVEVLTHDGSPWLGGEHIAVKARLGNLTGLGGASGYGLWTDSGFFTGTIDANAGYLGSLTVDGVLNVSTSGVIKSGAAGYNSGTGYWLEYNVGTPRVFIGNAAGNKLLWDGSNLSIVGSVAITGGSGIGNLTDAGDLATADVANWQTQVTGTGKPADYATVGATWGTNLYSVPPRFGDSEGAAGLYLTASYMGYWSGSAWPVFIKNDGTFQFAKDANSYVKWDGSVFEVRGTIKADAGYLMNLSVTGALNVATSGLIKSGQTAWREGIGYWWDYNVGSPRYSIGDPSTAIQSWGPSDFGSYTVHDDDLPLVSEETTSDKLAVQVTSPAAAGALDEVRLCLKRTGSPGGNIRIEMWTDNGGLPDSLLTAEDFEVTITDNLETMGTAFQSGELHTANGGAVPEVDTYFEVLGTGDFTGDDLATAKSSAPAANDFFKVTNNGVGTEAVEYIGNAIGEDGDSEWVACSDVPTSASDVVFKFGTSKPAIANSTIYHILLVADDDYAIDPGVDEIAWRVEVVGSGGTAETYEYGVGWTNITTVKATFRWWGGANELLITGATAKFGTAGSEEVVLDSGGIAIVADTAAYTDRQSYKFTDPASGDVISYLGSYITAGVTRARLQVGDVSGHDSQLRLIAGAGGTEQADAGMAAASGITEAYLYVVADEGAGVSYGECNVDFRIGGGLYVGSTAIDPDPDDIYFDGNLKSVKTSVYDVYAFHPLTTPLSHTSFNGDSFSDVSTSTKIENTSWSSTIPAEAKALLLNIYVRDSGSAGEADAYFAVGPNATYWYALFVGCGGLVNDAMAHGGHTVPCTDGDIYYRVAASGVDTLDVTMRCWGYWI